MIRNRQTLVLVTESYPLGHTTEEPFVLPEIRAALDRGLTVIVVPVSERGPACEAFKRLRGATVSYAVCRSPWMRHKLLRPLLAPGALLRYGPAATLSDLRYALAAEAVRRGLKAIVEQSTAIGEAFWFDFPALALTSLGIPTAVRAHRYELCSRRARRLRTLTIARSTGLHAVSRAGADALMELYPDMAGKISVAPLGTATDVSVRPPRDLAADRTVSFITIARATSVKRHGLCIEMTGWLAKARPGWQVNWTLIGGGPELERLRQAAANAMSLYPNLHIHLRGAMPHSEAMQTLDSGAYDFALLMSRSEGLPVSLMECMARGIPAVATDVGGTGEIVDDETGLLLPADADPEMFVSGLLPYLDSSYRYSRLCEAARTRITGSYDSTALRRSFIDTITRQ